MKPNREAVGIGEVAAAELADIAGRRASRLAGAAPSAPAPEPPPFSAQNWEDECFRMNLSAVAISGGGIRSATFALGVLQGLERKGLLQQADYLSTVSGGGYIGSWLQGLLYRDKGFAPLNPARVPEPPASDPITFLRKYSSYLAPRAGLSLDALTIPVIWLRNTVLNQAIIVFTLVAAVVLALVPGVVLYAQAVGGEIALSWAELIAAAIATAISVWTVGTNLRRIVQREFGNGAPAPGFHADAASEAVGTRAILPLTAAALLLVAAVVSDRAFSDSLLGKLISGLILAALHAGLQWRGGFVKCYTARRHRAAELEAWLHVLWMSVASAGFLWGLLFAIDKWVETWQPETIGGSQSAIAWGPPLFLLAVMAGVSLQIGLMGQDFPDASREWLARAGAFLVTVAAIWTLVFAVAVFAPLWVASLRLPMLSSGAAAWILSTAGGVFAGKSGNTGKSENGASLTSSALDLVARVGPVVAIAGFLVAVACLVHTLLYLPLMHPEDGMRAGFVATYWSRLKFEDPHVRLWALVLFLAAAAITVLLSLRVNINEFSLHHFYKNRLVRCYLGASATSVRVADPFTGFDPKDDIPLARLRWCKERPTTAPLPIVNAALNVTSGSELATQQRKAISWTFTPLYSGFVPAQSDADRAVSGAENKAYVDSAKILGGGVHLGTAMAISGAAASPNMGYHSSPQTAFLLTLFNVRLGWWTGNPRDARSFDRPGPLFALRWLLRELLGTVDVRSAYLSLSDGGHFENLGLYELVRRRCRYIIAIDAEQDGDYHFEGLGGAVRKCRADFGIEIDISPEAIRPKDGLSGVHCVVGRIYYREGDPGYLIYLKSSITGDEPADVREYQREAPDFPQQSTADQFFNESQFESYRRLGLHVAQTAFEGVEAGATFEECARLLWEQWGGEEADSRRSLS